MRSGLGEAVGVVGSGRSSDNGADLEVEEVEEGAREDVLVVNEVVAVVLDLGQLLTELSTALGAVGEVVLRDHRGLQTGNYYRKKVIRLYLIINPKLKSVYLKVS